MTLLLLLTEWCACKSVCLSVWQTGSRLAELLLLLYRRLPPPTTNSSRGSRATEGVRLLPLPLLPPPLAPQPPSCSILVRCSLLRSNDLSQQEVSQRQRRQQQQASRPRNPRGTAEGLRPLVRASDRPTHRLPPLVLLLLLWWWWSCWWWSRCCWPACVVCMSKALSSQRTK